MSLEKPLYILTEATEEEMSDEELRKDANVDDTVPIKRVVIHPELRQQEGVPHDTDNK